MVARAIVKAAARLRCMPKRTLYLYAVKNGANLAGATLYTTLSPCLPCARLIFSAGIKQVYFDKSYAQYKGLPSDEGVDFLRRFGVTALKMEEAAV
jgi:dCMP deaminase